MTHSTTKSDGVWKFPADLMAARTCYPDAKIEEHPEGYLFKNSSPPVPKTQVFIPKPL
jgi:hypothetical protein